VAAGVGAVTEAVVRGGGDDPAGGEAEAQEHVGEEPAGEPPLDASGGWPAAEVAFPGFEAAGGRCGIAQVLTV
jgi:hypothetical protein